MTDASIQQLHDSTVQQFNRRKGKGRMTDDRWGLRHIIILSIKQIHDSTIIQKSRRDDSMVAK